VGISAQCLRKLVVKFPQRCSKVLAYGTYQIQNKVFLLILVQNFEFNNIIQIGRSEQPQKREGGTNLKKQYSKTYNIILTGI